MLYKSIQVIQDLIYNMFYINKEIVSTDSTNTCTDIEYGINNLFVENHKTLSESLKEIIIHKLLW